MFEQVTERDEGLTTVAYRVDAERLPDLHKIMLLNFSMMKFKKTYNNEMIT